MSDLERQLLDAFRTECRDHIAGIRAALDAAGDSAGPEVEEAYRRAHSLKAAARVCDLETPAALGRRLEALFSAVRKGAVPLDAQTLAVARRATEALADWAGAWEAGGESSEPTEVLAAVDRLLSTGRAPEAKPRAGSYSPLAVSPPAQPRFDAESMDDALREAFQIEHREHLEGVRALLAQAEASGPTVPLVDEAFRRAHTLKGAARVAGLREAEAVAHRLESLLMEAHEDPARLDAAAQRAVHAGLDFIEDAAACLLANRPAPDPAAALAALGGAPAPDIAPAPAAEVAPSPAPVAESVRVDSEHLDRLLRSAEQLLTQGLAQSRVLRELGDAQRESQDLVRAWEAARSGVHRQLTAAPELAGVADLLHDLERRVRALARRVGRVRRTHRQDSSALNLLGRELRLDVRRARTVPAEGVFAGFGKMMRDLAHAEGKQIEFRASGLEVQADRMVLQALKDPLMHALRNAVCHGVEPADERRRQGKPPAGRVSLRLRVQGNRLRVTVEDDGRGIDLGRVAAEAVRRGMLGDAEAVAASPEDLTALLFRPAFSTAGEVTDLAGRGMGLSVVQEAVARLQGEVRLTSQGAGTGARVVITVPLSIAAQRLLLVRCGEQTFALPTHSVEQVRRARAADIESVAGRRALLLNGEPVPLESLAALLGVAPDEAPPDPLPVALVRLGGRHVALAVDELLGERESLLEGLDAPATDPGRWAGAVLLEDGAVCLVLNPLGMGNGSGMGNGEWGMGNGKTQAVAPKRDAPALHSPFPIPHSPFPSHSPSGKTILVVDDSLTTRTLERSILEAHGFRVRLALDGMEALAKLAEELPDLVITDIQMPRLDGFGLLERMKADPKLARVPVIVVSSLERREEQERGLALGADAYVVKRKFDHEELLAIIGQIL